MVCVYNSLRSSNFSLFFSVHYMICMNSIICLPLILITCTLIYLTNPLPILINHDLVVVIRRSKILILILCPSLFTILLIILTRAWYFITLNILLLLLMVLMLVLLSILTLVLFCSSFFSFVIFSLLILIVLSILEVLLLKSNAVII